jgi:uncharacterized protein YggE
MRIAHRWGRVALVASLLTGGTPASRAWAAADGTPPGGTVTGTARLERRPDVMRVQFDVAAEAGTMKDAVAQLRAKEKAAREKLAKLGAAEGSVRVDDPRGGAAGEQDPQAQVNRMLRGRLGQQPNRPATGPAAPSVKVAARVRAEWKLPAGSADELLVAAQELTAKVKAADLAGKADRKAASPEEQEEAEERAMMNQANGVAAADDVATTFVSRVSEEDRAKLLAEAFGRAKRDAARLAKAAGSEAGPVHQLTATAAAGDADPSNPYGRFVQAQMAMAGQAGQPTSDDPDAAEAVGVTAGSVTYLVSLSATFSLH